MKIFLTSTVKHPKVIKAMKDYVKGFEGKNMVYIPTAAHSEEGFGVYKTGGTFNLMSSLCPNLQILELEFATDNEAQDLVNRADILFLAGGYPVYLSYWLHRRNLKELIRERVSKGMYLIGTSAGAMVLGPTLTAADYFNKEVFADVAYGLGYMDFEVWPHYLEKHKNIIDKDFKNIKIKPLKNGEYIITEIRNAA
ncbi:peptidase, S51 family [sediment metagenome]|uniref:Peptidase, S51 family n=1 Tax=sediment metagenome TaxID=749907 RepID=D9PJR9_9ZZZZ